MVINPSRSELAVLCDSVVGGCDSGGVLDKLPVWHVETQTRTRSDRKCTYRKERAARLFMSALAHRQRNHLYCVCAAHDCGA